MQEIDYGVKNEINTLVLEHDILTKTIFRLYQQDSHLTKIQRDKLLTRYQYQLGIITAKIKKLEEIITNKDANTLEERLVSVIEQKFSNMDKKIQAALDSKNSSQIQHPEQKSTKSRKEEYSWLGRKAKNAHSLGLELSSYKHKPLEITTLSEVPSKIPEFFQSNFKPPKLKVENIQSKVDVAKVVENVIQSNVCTNPGCTNPKFTNKYCSVHTDSYEKETNENKASLPSLGLEQPETKQHILKENPVELSAQESSKLAQNKKDGELSQDDDLEENDDDVKNIKAQIEKSLANLDQAEVE